MGRVAAWSRKGHGSHSCGIRPPQFKERSYIVDYYVAPEQEIFEDIKENAIKIWNSYDDFGGYRTEKVNRIKDLENVRDNTGHIVAMFDNINQNKLLIMVKPETREWLGELLRQSRGGGRSPTGVAP